MVANSIGTDWPSLGIVCPSCGNRGADDAAWLLHGRAPFRLVEDVSRSWLFSAKLRPGGRLVVVADADHDHVDWEAGSNRRLECMQCLAQFPLTAEMSVEFE
jgi:hypothetical protein